MKASTLRAATRRQSDLSTRVSAIERAAQSSYRSIEGGTMTVYDEDGSPVQSIGIGVDGTVGVQDLIDTDPCAPTDVTVVPGTESLQVRWDGEYVDDQPVGVTVAYVAVHASQDDADEWDESTEVAQLPAVGGTLSVPADSDVETTVVLIAVSAAGVWSEPSEEVAATPLYYNSDLDDLVVQLEQDLVAAQEAIVQQALGIAAAAADAASALGAATTAQTTANGKNTVTYSTSAPSGATNGNFTPAVAGDVWFRRSGAVIIGQWEFVPGTGWVSRSVDGALVANFDAAYITTGFIDVANRVKAGSITTPLLAVTGANVFPDPEFQNTDWLVPNGTVLPATPSGRFGNGTGWDYYTAANGARAVRYTVPNGAPDGLFNVFPTLSGASQAKDGWLSVEEGSTYLARFAHFKTATRHKVYANWVKADGTTGASDFICREDGTVWVTAGGNTTTFRSYILAVPAGVTRIAVRVQVQGTAGQTWAMYGQGITLSRMGDGELIVDGSITTSKLSATAIDGITITGSIFQSSAAAGNGTAAGWRQSTSGIFYWGPGSATPTFSVSGTTGLMTARGATIEGIVNAQGGTITGDFTVTNSGNLYIVDGGQMINWGTNTYAQVAQGEVSVGTRNGVGAPVLPRTRMLPDRLVFEKSGASTAIRVDTNDDLLLDAPRDAWLRGTSRVVLAALGGDLDLRTSAYVTSTAIRDFQAATTNSRQVWVNNNTGRLHTPSSARRMKRDFRPLNLPDPYAVLDLEPTLYRNKAEVAEWEANGTFTRTTPLLDDAGHPVLDEEGYPVELVEQVPLPEPGWEIGLVADDVEQIPGMKPFVQYDQGLTSGLHYDRMWEALIPAVRDIVRRLDLIEGAP